MSTLACQCGTRLKRPSDPAIRRGKCPACGLMIVFDDAPTLEVEDSPPEPRSVTVSLGSLTTSGGDFLSFSVHVDQVGAASVLINACEGRRRNLHTIMLTRQDYAGFLELVRKVDATIDGLSARDRRRRDG